MEWDCVVYFAKLKDMKEERSPGIQRQRELSFFMLQRGFLEYFGERLESCDLDRTKQGKPYFKKRQGCYFNISHCRDAVTAAFAEVPVGVDIESDRRIRRSIMNHALSAAEQDYVLGKRKRAEELLDGEEMRRFLRLWTLKESYVKMTGEGLRHPLHEVEFFLGEALIWEHKGELPRKEWRLWRKDSFCCLNEIDRHMLSLSLKTEKKDEVKIILKKME